LLAWAVPALAVVLRPRAPIAAAAGILLIATVFAAVYHAEVVAHRVGEPFGALRLAVAVTVVEVALIVSMMIGTSGSEALAAIQCSPLS
jgi:Ca2+:H+ antiporter